MSLGNLRILLHDAPCADAFQALHHLGHGLRRLQREQQMDVLLADEDSKQRVRLLVGDGLQ